MKQIAHDEAKINTVKLSSQGQVTLSKEAREQQGLSSGETLIEISLPGCIILLPQSQVLADLMLRAQEGLGRLGLGVDELKARVAKRQQESTRKKYPGILDGKK
jgi:bifunctional DNA-binding transcriptional regulator/antitoxin component of YhaV-PrlF toxin-antitoxin module